MLGLLPIEFLLPCVECGDTVLNGYHRHDGCCDHEDVDIMSPTSGFCLDCGTYLTPVMDEDYTWHWEVEVV
jgi:hypothetical protein